MHVFETWGEDAYALQMGGKKINKQTPEQRKLEKTCLREGLGTGLVI